ncbi:g protein-coupled receptor [Anaeramoeba ignava]|uniref:G protein-coupled receptor n=1 Tax=Anaeramoeba ignava TaxID=1746090 RepID=A0A9Q0LK51_ANAIG|nr:g protein-coupled receptor [Anaeramoeba ignava]
MIHNKESIPAIIGSTIGMAGSLIFILVYLFLKEIQDSARKFIFILSIYDFFLAFFAILPGPSSSGLCKFQGFALGFIFTASFSLIFLTSLVFYLKICYAKNVDESKKFFIIGNFVVFLISLIIAIIYIIFGKIGPGSTHWCWVTEVKLGPVNYSVIWFDLLGTIILYSITFFKLRKDPKYPKSFQYKIFALGWIYLVTQIWSSIKRIRELMNPNAPNNLFLDVMQSLAAPMLGIWDAVFFVFFDKNVRSLLKFKFKKRKYGELNPSIGNLTMTKVLVDTNDI